MNSALALQNIFHKDSLNKYSPPGHEGTVNVRLTEKAFCSNFELILGEIDEGGVAERHSHETEHQAIYILAGNARVTLGDEPSVDCGPGEVIQLPPKLDHHIVSTGPGSLLMVIVYSPPLAPRNDVSVEVGVGSSQNVSQESAVSEQR